MPIFSSVQAGLVEVKLLNIMAKMCFKILLHNNM